MPAREYFALLVRVYTHAAVTLADPRYRQVVAETVGYVLRDLRQHGGPLSSAEDADSPDADGHGHEGLFHTWTPDEVRAVVGDEADVVMAHYGITDGGNCVAFCHSADHACCSFPFKASKRHKSTR